MNFKKITHLHLRKSSLTFINLLHDLNLRVCTLLSILLSFALLASDASKAKLGAELGGGQGGHGPPKM